ncbi:MAG TPA: hypothetical protein VK993_02360 [Chthoniobacterales bacterium]|nr:hypothetical protein [Chthoniobacterales bacterium]
MESTTDNVTGTRYLPKAESDFSFPAARTALLVIDPVNDFLSEGGARWELTKNTVKVNDVVGLMCRNTINISWTGEVLVATSTRC